MKIIIIVTILTVKLVSYVFAPMFQNKITLKIYKKFWKTQKVAKIRILNYIRQNLKCSNFGI